MRDKLYFGIIGLLVGLVVAQWSMPTGEATVATDPVGNVVALAGDIAITVGGEMYFWSAQGWVKVGDLPFPVSQLHFASVDSGNEMTLVDKSGNYYHGGSALTNRGQVPGGPISTQETTWGGVKGQYNEDK